MNKARLVRGDVSVIVVAYNAGAHLANCVASALAAAAVAEIIVSDNASGDGSIEALESRFGAEPRLRVIRNGANLGFAGACNIGAAAAGRGDLLFLNPDCVLEPATVRRALDVLAGRPDAAMVGGLLQNPDGSEQAGGRRAVPTPWRSLVRALGLSRLGERYPRLFSDFLLHREPLPQQPIEVEAISGAFMLVRQEALADVGLLDDGYFMHCEDLDWCMRFRRKGWNILFVPDARVVHFKGACSRSRPIFVEWHKHKGMVRFYRKFFRHQYPGIVMGLVVVGVWIRFAVVAGYHALRRVARGSGPAVS